MSWGQNIAEWAVWFWPFFINHLWQTTLFGGIAWATVRSTPRLTTRGRMWIWSAALLKFALPSALLMWALGPAGFRGLGEMEEPIRGFLILTPTGPGDAGATSGSGLLYIALTLLWLGGAAGFLGRWGLQRRRFRQSLQRGRWLTTGPATEALDRAKTALNFGMNVRMFESDRSDGLGVWGVARPIIMIPQGIDDRLSRQELQTVLMHELSHIRRRDNLTASVQMLICCLFWFHPLVWRIDRRLLAEREMLCDETVAASCENPAVYLSGLWKIVQFGLGGSPAGVSRAMGSDIKRRIEHMISFNSQDNRSFSKRSIGNAFAAAVIVLTLALSIFLGGGARAQETTGGEANQDALTMTASMRPKILYQEKAEYTAEAKKNRVEGLITLRAVFAKDGVLRDIEVVQSLPDGLTDQAIIAAKTIRFEPAQKDGLRVSVRGMLEYNFSLKD